MDLEKLKILKMIEEKKITAEEAAKLLDALGGETGRPEEPRAKQTGTSARQLKLKVSDIDTGRAKVNLCIPVGIAHILKSLIPAQELSRLEQQGIDLNSILQAINSDTIGKIFDVEDEEHHNHVEISIE
jgi:DUF4097 and DUF4098 domain-containing protein YvlB